MITDQVVSVEWESPETTNWIEHAGGKSSFPILHVTSDDSGGYCGGGGTTNLFHAIATPQTFVSSALYETGLDGVTPGEAGIDPEDPVICIAVPTNCVTMNPSYRGQYAALDVYSTYKLYLGPEAEEEYYYDDCSTLIEHYQGGTNSFCVKAPLTLRFSRSYSYMRPVEHFAPKIGALNGNGPHVKEMNAAFLSSIVVASDWPNMHPVQIITPSSSRWQFFNSNLYGYGSNTNLRQIARAEYQNLLTKMFSNATVLYGKNPAEWREMIPVDDSLDDVVTSTRFNVSAEMTQPQVMETSGEWWLCLIFVRYNEGAAGGWAFDYAILNNYEITKDPGKRILTANVGVTLGVTTKEKFICNPFGHYHEDGRMSALTMIDWEWEALKRDDEDD